MQALRPLPDVSLQITVPAPNPSDPPLISAERRISPAWTVEQLKGKLESVTGIPPGCQILELRGSGRLEPDERGLAEWLLVRGAEIEVHDTRPSRANPLLDPSASEVEKFTLSESEYASRDDSVLKWKQTQKLGRFDPNSVSALPASERARLRREKDVRAVNERNVVVGQRCRVNESDERRGRVNFIGEVEEIKGKKMPGDVQEKGFEEDGAIWVGVEFDEPVGKNDGTVSSGKRYFECKGSGYGSFVRPDRVECGEQWAPLDELEAGSDMEEI